MARTAKQVFDDIRGEFLAKEDNIERLVEDELLAYAALVATVEKTVEDMEACRAKPLEERKLPNEKILLDILTKASAEIRAYKSKMRPRPKRR